MSLAKLTSAEVESNIPKVERTFDISRNNKGLPCPFRAVLCQEGYCHECQIYLDWLRKNGNNAGNKGLARWTTTLTM